VGQEKFQSQPNNLQPSGKLAQQLPDFMLEKKKFLVESEKQVVEEEENALF
jgi:trans-aconitate methyltransferase